MKKHTRDGDGDMEGGIGPKRHSAKFSQRFGGNSTQSTKHILRFGLVAFVLSLCFTGSLVADIRIANVSVSIDKGKYDEATQTLQKLAKSTKDIDQLSWIYHQVGEIHYSYTREYSKALTAYI